MAPKVEFQLLFQQAPGNNLILSTDLVILAVSDAYLRATMTTRQAVVGRPLFEVFPDNPDDPAASGVTNLRRSLEQVVDTARPHRMAVQKYDIRRPESEGGAFEERYWSPLTTPVLRDDGSVAYLLHSVEDVTDLVQLQQQQRVQAQELRELAFQSERRYAQLLDTAPDAIVVVGEDGLISFVNTQTVRLFGYPRADLVGRSLDLLLPERLRSVHGVHVARFLQRPVARSMGSGFELFGLTREGREIPIEVSLSPLHTESGTTVSAAIRDISERKRLEAAAKLVSERLASAVEAIQEAFALFDDADTLVLCNSVYRQLIGDALPGPLVGKSYEQVIDAWMGDIAFVDDEARAHFRDARLSQRHEVTSSFDLRMRDGRRLRVLDRRTAEGGLVKTIWDLTDDLRLSEELRAAQLAAEMASNAKSDFLSSMSHELRTPLNSILGFAQLLQRDKREPLSERHRQRVAHILTGGEHLLRLIDDILDLSRVESGKVAISTEPLDVPELLSEVLTTLEPTAARQEIQLAFETPDGAPRIAGDRTRFLQILMNFGSNAIKYNRPGGHVVFSVTKPRPGIVRVLVGDDGIGVPADKQVKLFQPFQRAGQETGTIEGTGIGLFISKRLAQLMRGDVGFRSLPSGGSEFWVDMPEDVSAKRPSIPPGVREGGAARLTAGGRKLVLYVEDNPANVAFMRDLMSACEDIDLLLASTAEQGIELAREHRPDVILMDINLPGQSGLDALRVLRGTPETSNIPVVALSAAASERDRQRGRQAGFHQYLTKPVKVDEFMAALDNLLARG